VIGSIPIDRECSPKPHRKRNTHDGIITIRPGF
jgi:hypothetical protein